MISCGGGPRNSETDADQESTPDADISVESDAEDEGDTLPEDSDIEIEDGDTEDSEFGDGDPDDGDVDEIDDWEPEPCPPVVDNLVGFLRLDGISHDAEYDGSWAYVASSFGLHIVDLTDPEDPSLTSSLEELGRIEDIAFEDSMVYVVPYSSRDHNLRIVDVSDPESPALTSVEIEIGGSAGDIDVSEGYLYIPVFHEGIKIVDIRDPLSPEVVTVFASDWERFEATSVTIFDSIMYVSAMDRGFLIVDVSDPTEPILLWGQEEYPSPDSDVRHVYYTSKNGEYLYVGSGGSGMTIWDVSEPEVPVELFHYPHIFGRRAEFRGDHVIAEASSRGFDIYDFDEIKGLSAVHHHDMPGGVAELTVLEDYAYITTFYGGLWILDISADSLPNVSFESYSHITGDKMVFADRYLYVGDDWENTIRIYDGRPPFEEVDVVDLGFYVRYFHDFFVKESALFVIYSGDENTGYFIIDLSIPESPEMIAHFPNSGVSRMDVSDDGTIAYILQRNDPRGLVMLDISDPSRPSWITTYEIEEDVYGLDVREPYVYVGLRQGLLTIDVTDRENPIEANRLEHDDWRAFTEIVHSENILVALYGRYNDSAYAMIFDLEDPASPRLLSEYQTFATTYDQVMIFDDGLYLLHESSLDVIDISAPEAPEIRWSPYMSGSPFSNSYRDFLIHGHDGYLLGNRDLTVFERCSVR